jgi:CTP synthase (UTP-ammonia lyase)
MAIKQDLVKLILELINGASMKAVAADEVMKVASVSLKGKSLSIEDRREIFQIAKELLKSTAVQVFLEKKVFNPTIFLLSSEKLYFCEIQNISTDQKNRYSLIGKYAKKYKCFGAIFAGLAELSFSKSKNIDSLLIVSMAYDERLCDNGMDASVESYVFNTHELIKVPININLEKDIQGSLLNGMRKPIENIATLPLVNFN